MCSYHCFVRGKQRFNLSIEDTANITERAYLKGRLPEEYTGRERCYLSNKEKGNTSVKVLGNIIFIFNELEMCVTLYLVPPWFGREKRHVKTLTEKFDDMFADCPFADIIYNNQLKTVISA